jgi:hypothetical protein
MAGIDRYLTGIGRYWPVFDRYWLALTGIDRYLTRYGIGVLLYRFRDRYETFRPFRPVLTGPQGERMCARRQQGHRGAAIGSWQVLSSVTVSGCCWICFSLSRSHATGNATRQRRSSRPVVIGFLHPQFLSNGPARIWSNKSLAWFRAGLVSIR